MKNKETFTTRDGRQLTIRYMRDNDAALLVDMFHHLSARTKRFRFHSYVEKLPDEQVWRKAVALSTLDPRRQVALVAIWRAGDGDHAVGVARFSRAAPDDIEAEAAIVVRDDFQRAGLGTCLMFRLMHIAHSMGIRYIMAWVMAENRQVLRMLQKSGLPHKQSTSRGETKLSVSIAEIDKLWTKFE
ncbi:MAG TPA: GNAT family N-acetyltransferase [Chloroflexi bacterium]|nr:GNAT family N-acetyltransferase [Chloroflexota bacterium]